MDPAGGGGHRQKNMKLANSEAKVEIRWSSEGEENRTA